MTARRQMSKDSYKNLRQNKELSDEEFDDLWDQRQAGIKKDINYEKRIQNKIDNFGEDYDLNDLKANDNLTLRALAQAYITLEDYEVWASQLRGEGITLDRILELEKLGNIMSKLRNDISSMQNDLNITRKIRKGDSEASVINELAALHKKAKEFYEERMSYVYCPKCKMLLATIWFHWPQDKANKVVLHCNRKLDNDELCGNKVVIGSAELMAQRGVNIDSVPEFFK